MKKKILKVSSMLLLVVSVAFMFTSCKSKQNVIAQKDDGEVEIKMYCSGDEYNSSPKALRYSAVGESMDQMTSKKKAMSDARAGLAASINTQVKAVVDNYVNSGNFNNKEELMKKYEGLNREVINQSLSGVIVKCERMTRTKAGNYKSYVCVELGSDDILKTINNRATNDEMLKVDYNYEKFKKTFETEMNKLGK